MQRIPAVTLPRRSPAALRPRTARAAAGAPRESAPRQIARAGPPPEIEDAFTRGGIANRRQLAIGLLLAVLLLVAVGRGARLAPVRRRAREALVNERARVVSPAASIDTYFSGELARCAAIAERAPGRATATPRRCALFPARSSRATAGAFSAASAGSTPRHLPRLEKRRRGRARLELADRSYFQSVMATGPPFVSEGIAARGSNGSRDRHGGAHARRPRAPHGRARGRTARQRRSRSRSGTVDLGGSGRRGARPPGSLRCSAVSRGPRNTALSRAAAQARESSPTPAGSTAERSPRRLRDVRAAGLDDRDRPAALRHLRGRAPRALPRARTDRRGGGRSCSA